MDMPCRQERKIVERTSCSGRIVLPNADGIITLLNEERYWRPECVSSIMQMDQKPGKEPDELSAGEFSSLSADKRGLS